MTQRISVAVAGAGGYSGGELLRILAGHPALSADLVTGASKVGQQLTAVHPQFTGVYDLTIAPTEPSALAGHDLVFLALPHGQSAELARHLPEQVVVIDLGADHRLRNAADWEQFYGSGHAGTWTYGLPELPGQRQNIRDSTRVANPGCYPTAITLALAPLLQAGLVEAEDLVVVAASGTSGAGRSAQESLLGSEVMGSMSAYKVGGVHQHTPEIEQSLRNVCGRPVSLSFTPTLAPMPRGILATCTARLSGPHATADLRDALRAQYASEPFVQVLPDDSWPRTAAVAGANAVHLQVAADPRTGRAVVVAAMDNLVKGAAGQAVQNANLVLGLPETTGLTAIAVAP